MSAERAALTLVEANRFIERATKEIREEECLIADPTVSVGILTFRHVDTIRQCVESVLSQVTAFPFEIIIADDKSEDGTVELIQELQQKFPDRIRLLLGRENLGQHTGNGRLNLIRLWRASRGKYFHLLEGDDWWTSPDKLAKQVALMEKHPECTLCWHRGEVVYDEEVPPEARILEGVVPPEDYEEVNEGSVLFWSNRCLTSSVLYRRGIVEDFPEDFLNIRIGDWPLQVLHAREGKVGFIDEKLSAYRCHAAGIWSGKAAFDQVIGFMVVMAEIHDWIPEAHRGTYVEKLGQHLAFPLSWSKPYQLGAGPGKNLAAVAEILKVPGVEEAFVEQLESYRSEAQRLSEEREQKLVAAREQVAKLKGKLEKERAKIQDLKNRPKKKRRWLGIGPKR